MEPSKRFSLSSYDWKKVGICAGVAVAGALLTYLTPIITGLDLGALTPIVVAVWSIIANIVRKWIADYTI